MKKKYLVQAKVFNAAVTVVKEVVLIVSYNGKFFIAYISVK